MDENNPLRVVAGVILNQDKVLIALRRGDAEQGGLWEFPGGKVEQGETDSDALVRELKEELGVEVTVGKPITQTLHHYPAKSILLCSYLCTLTTGQPSAFTHQEIRWIAPDELSPEIFSAADQPLVKKLVEHSRSTSNSMLFQ